MQLYKAPIMHCFRRALFVVLLACCAIGTTRAAEADETEIDAAPEADFLQLADAFRNHCVRVHIQAQSFNGETPAVGTFADDIRNERPTLIGGYWWDDTHVIIPDTGLQDRFIHSIEIAMPGTDETYPTRLAGRFVALQAVLLEVVTPEGRDKPQASPLEFIDGDIDEAFLFAYVHEDGERRIKTDTALGAMAVSDDGVETVAVANRGVFIDAEGNPLGLAFGDKVVVEDETYDGISAWRGPELPYTPLFSAADEEDATAELRQRLADAVLECRFNIRIKVDDDEEGESSSWMADDANETGQTRELSDIRAAGVVVGPRHLLVPLALSAAGIRRIEDIIVVRPDGRELEANFTGALRRYQAVVVEVAEDLPAANLPTGFAALNPVAGMTAPDAGDAPRIRPMDEYIQRWRIDYAQGRRREVVDHDRWLGTFRGLRGEPIVTTRTSEEDGHLAFDVDGNLVAVALTPRRIHNPGRTPGGAPGVYPGFRPVDFLRRQFASSDVFDPALTPMDEEEGRRLVDLGVEFQSLDAGTARLFRASRETRGGETGVLVSHVYPGSIADIVGLREKDVLVRLFIEGRKEPVEVSTAGFAGSAFDMDMSSESFRQLLRYLPAPWPQRDNAVSRVLTEAGVGRTVALLYVRDGVLGRAEFETRYGEPDYRSVRKERFRRLGVTVKPITFEVARYFGRAEGSGVIISHVESGGRGAVAELYQYLLVTRVDGAPVGGMDDFKAAVAAFEDGEAASVELTVEDFGKTRLVKIE